jgi:hypothetical protein
MICHVQSQLPPCWSIELGTPSVLLACELHPKEKVLRDAFGNFLLFTVK